MGTPASSTTKTGCHDIAEILLKNQKKKKNQSISPVLYFETDIKIHNFTFSLSPVLHLYIFRQILLYHLQLRVECTLFCNLQSWARTHAVLVISLYELLDPTT
jgi:hypothetical protein